MYNTKECSQWQHGTSQLWTKMTHRNFDANCSQVWRVKRESTCFDIFTVCRKVKFRQCFVWFVSRVYLLSSGQNEASPFFSKYYTRLTVRGMHLASVHWLKMSGMENSASRILPLTAEQLRISQLEEVNVMG